jgi:beta-galactosidase
VIRVDYTLKVTPGLPNIPKIGMQMGIDKNYTRIEYFGKGPLENYIDRRYGMDAGIYDQDIYDFIEPYVVPQENGNRTDVRWMYLSDPVTKDGLLIVADSLLSMSAWPILKRILKKQSTPIN